MPNVERALISVADKRGIVELTKGLAELNIHMEATSGTYYTLTRSGLEGWQVEQIPLQEHLGGKIKTLNPKIFMAVLVDRSNRREMSELKSAMVEPYDLVVVNLYTDKIDVGGAVLLRAAAKNFHYVVSVCDLGDYPEILSHLKTNNRLISEELSFELAVKTLRYLSEFDLKAIEILHLDKK